MVESYVKVPVPVSAIEYNGNIHSLKEYGKDVKKFKVESDGLLIPHKDEYLKADIGDLIIYNYISKEYYPCKPDIFEKTYDKCPSKKDDNYYVKKQVTIEALEYTGDNILDVKKFCNNNTSISASIGDNVPMIIHTLEGDATLNKGDYVIKGVNGEFYPCSKEVFEKSYIRL